jgi:hypothetical protein
VFRLSVHSWTGPPCQGDSAPPDPSPGGSVFERGPALIGATRMALRRGDAQEVRDLGPGIALIACVGNCPGRFPFGRAREQGERNTDSDAGDAVSTIAGTQGLATLAHTYHRLRTGMNVPRAAQPPPWEWDGKMMLEACTTSSR